MNDLRMIAIKEDIYRVEGEFNECGKHSIGSGYIFGSIVLPYFGEISENDKKYMTEVGIYAIIPKKINDGKIHFNLRDYHIIKPETEDELDSYNVRNIKNMDIKDMILDKDIKTNDIAETRIDADIYVPVISPKDDMAMQVIKFGIGRKGIDPRDYDSRFETPYARNNMQRMMDAGGGTMKLSKAVEIADIFDMGLVIGIYDKEGSVPNPIDKDGVKRIYYMNHGGGLPLDQYESINLTSD